MKKYKWRLLLAALFLVFLGFPPAVLTRVQVSFSDSGYEKAENLKILTSRSDETIPFSGLQTTYGKKGESRNAVRYYAEAGHNLPPDIRDDSVSPAIGTYGTTRLAEKTPYYFYAGKLFSLFPGEHMERLFGLCLGIGLVLYQLACETSMLNRLIRKGAEKRDVGRILLLGLLFGHVLTAKANYYVILIYAFFMLLVPFLEEDRRGQPGITGRWGRFMRHCICWSASPCGKKETRESGQNGCFSMLRLWFPFCSFCTMRIL